MVSNNKNGSLLVMDQTRWRAVLPERIRQQFMERLKDPYLYSLRNEIAMIEVYTDRLLSELRYYQPQEDGADAPVTIVETDGRTDPSRLTFAEEQVWGRYQEAVELKAKLVAQEVKTLELLQAHSGRQMERAQGINAVVIETLRNKLADTPEGRRLLVELADELEVKVRQLQDGEIG